jgi:hypothetical protein
LTPFKSLKTSISQTFVNNMFDAAATIMAKLQKKRWQIESFLKQQKQNFELKEFYSDEDKGTRMICNDSELDIYRHPKTNKRSRIVFSRRTNGKCKYSVIFKIF